MGGPDPAHGEEQLDKHINPTSSVWRSMFWSLPRGGLRDRVPMKKGQYRGPLGMLVEAAGIEPASASTLQPALHAYLLYSI